MSKFYSFDIMQNGGDVISTSSFEGKVIFIINTASLCGFKEQIKEIEQIYNKYHQQGLEILVFPCNQFANNEPGTNEEIAKIYKEQFGLNLRIMNKVNVNGPDAIPLYEWIKVEKPGVLGFKGIKWNFEKFLVTKNGKVFKRYSSVKTPLSLSDDIERLLNQ